MLRAVISLVSVLGLSILVIPTELALAADNPNVKPDNRVEFEKSDIFDWTYTENGKVKGNYTACPLLLAGPKEQLEQYREIYGIVCD